MDRVQRLKPRFRRHQDGADDAAGPLLDDIPRPATRRRGRHRVTVIYIALIVTIMAALYKSASYFTGNQIPITSTCDSVHLGYQCQPEISHYWGQYSPFFSVPSEIDSSLPETCELVFGQVLSRHGARWPTEGKTQIYGTFVTELQRNVTSFTGKYAFLQNYRYELGAASLTDFGRQQMINSGIKFFDRYQRIAKDLDPFIRTTDSQRVDESARLFAEGFHEAKQEFGKDDSYPYATIVLPEHVEFNNTLHAQDSCHPFSDYVDEDKHQTRWRRKWTAPIIQRLTKDLPGLVLEELDVVKFMELCPFETANSLEGIPSPFCQLFTQEEWKDYDYQQALAKWYYRGNGNPLAATVGVGYVNELIARMTNQPVRDHTSTNRTLDSDPGTFPIGDEFRLFADFTHDNSILPVLAALGVYNATAPLSAERRQSTNETNGFSCSWAVPFGARVYFEKMKCAGEDDELVRVLVNDRVVPLETCGGDELGRCKLKNFVESLSFARAGGNWSQCQVKEDIL